MPSIHSGASEAIFLQGQCRLFHKLILQGAEYAWQRTMMLGCLLKFWLRVSVALSPAGSGTPPCIDFVAHTGMNGNVGDHMSCAVLVARPVSSESTARGYVAKTVWTNCNRLRPPAAGFVWPTAITGAIRPMPSAVLKGMSGRPSAVM